MAVMQLSLAELTALQAIQADIERLQRKREVIMREAGLETGKQYAISLDGEVTEQGNGPTPINP